MEIITRDLKVLSGLGKTFKALNVIKNIAAVAFIAFTVFEAARLLIMSGKKLKT